MNFQAACFLCDARVNLHYIDTDALIALYRYFPWDKQNCPLELGSWTYDSSALSISKYGDAGDTR